MKNYRYIAQILPPDLNKGIAVNIQFINCILGNIVNLYKKIDGTIEFDNTDNTDIKIYKNLLKQFPEFLNKVKVDRYYGLYQFDTSKNDFIENYERLSVNTVKAIIG